jgi:sec-independent protein translocase protein TatC
MEPPSQKQLLESSLGYLDQLRFGLLRYFFVWLAGLILCFAFAGSIARFLQQPLLQILPPGKQHLYFTGIADKFLVHVKVSFLTSLVLTLPFLLYQIWQSLGRHLFAHQKRYLFAFLFFGTLSFVAGMAFAYCVVIPLGYKYLIEFGSPNDRAVITLTRYFSLTLQILFVAGLVFELPVVLILMGRMGLVSHRFLIRYRKYAIFANTILAAIATPSPDWFTYGIILVPMILLYEVSIVGVWWVTRGRPSLTS